MEAAMVGTVGQLAAPAVRDGGTSVCNWLKRKYGYAKHIDKNFKKLEEEIKCVSDKGADVQTELDNNILTKEKTRECETWLKQVAEIRSEIETLEYDYQNKPSTCLCGLWPYCSLHELGKRIVEKTTEATALKEERDRITIMRDKPASIPHSHRWNNDVRIVDYPSQENHVATLLGWLNEERMKRVCIWGPPGVGKTTIMKIVHDRVLESRLFDHIFRVNVTAENIQEVIWTRLGMTMDINKDPLWRAAVISEMLNDKKYVLFLDEVSSAINLEEVGIHSNHKQGKVVFASREKYIGPTDEDMNVRRLSKEDAGKLFWELVGSHLERRRAIKRIAERIIDLCGGMPPIIMLIGKKLEGEEDPAIWRDIKSQLQSPSREPWQNLEEYYRSFKLVYDALLEDGHKKCLLYWAIFPLGEEINRDYMIDCWIAEQFLQQQRLHATRDRGHAVLAEFVRKLLVEKGEKLGHFKMFDCFQNAAFRLAKQDLKIFVPNGETINHEEWKQAKRVSLAGVKVLPERPQCRGMLTLFFHENSLTEFPAEFFKFMTGLQVLSLKKTGITTLPSSISRLKNLKGLFLKNGSQLVQLPRQIGDLQNLEILDITGIYSLPSEIGQLRNLKCFRVSFIDAGNQNHVRVEKKIPRFGNGNSNGVSEQMIPPNTIRWLTNLEELSLDVSRNIRRWNETADAIVFASEIAMLEKLTHLHFYFSNLKSFETFIQYSRSWNAKDTTGEFVGFRSFSIFVGQQRNSSASDFSVIECSAQKHLQFSAGDGFPRAVSEVLKEANSFELLGHTTACNLTDDLAADTLQELEACVVEECNEMQSIVNGNPTGGVVFQCLEKLHIKKLPRLVRIWDGTIAPQSFCALTSLTLKECGGIRKLFSMEMVIRLSELQNLQVEDCAIIEEIIEGEGIVESRAFPKLKNFQLCSLPSLSCICDASFEWPSLETILIKTCEALKSLPGVLEKTSKLREIQCDEDWWNQQDWPTNNDTEERFRTRRRNPS